MVGSLSDVIMVNSTWTYGHISFLWRFTFERMTGRQRIHIVYPPCDVQSLQNLALDKKRENIVLSIGQFRPEKDHALQIKSFARLIQKHPELGRKEGGKNVKLILVGSCRNRDDEQLVEGLRSLASSLNISASIDFVLNKPFPVLKDLFQRASAGIRE
jgi:alpha-1,2-mannosyltransferase